MQRRPTEGVGRGYEGVVEDMRGGRGYEEEGARYGREG